MADTSIYRVSAEKYTPNAEWGELVESSTELVFVLFKVSTSVRHIRPGRPPGRASIPPV